MCDYCCLLTNDNHSSSDILLLPGQTLWRYPIIKLYLHFVSVQSRPTLSSNIPPQSHAAQGKPPPSRDTPFLQKTKESNLYYGGWQVYSWSSLVGFDTWGHYFIGKEKFTLTSSQGMEEYTASTFSSVQSPSAPTLHCSHPQEPQTNMQSRSQTLLYCYANTASTITPALFSQANHLSEDLRNLEVPISHWSRINGNCFEQQNVADMMLCQWWAQCSFQLIYWNAVQLPCE